MKEKSCVFRFIAESQMAFAKGDSFQGVRSTIPHYKELVKRLDGNIKRSVFHNIATSTIGLNFLTGYEFSRIKGLPLPDANNIIQTIFPITKKSSEVLSKEEKIRGKRNKKIDLREEAEIFQEEG